MSHAFDATGACTGDSTLTTTPAIARSYQRSRRLLAGVLAMAACGADADLRRQLLRSALSATMRCLEARHAGDDESVRRCLEDALGAALAVTRMSAGGGEGESIRNGAANEISALASRSAREIEAALADSVR